MVISSTSHEAINKIRLGSFTYPSVLNACGEEYEYCHWEGGRCIRLLICGASCKLWNLVVQNYLVSLYRNLGSLELWMLLITDLSNAIKECYLWECNDVLLCLYE